MVTFTAAAVASLRDYRQLVASYGNTDELFTMANVYWTLTILAADSPMEVGSSTLNG